MSEGVSARASVPTANGGRYLQQLCKHWQHNLAVEYDAERGRVVFPANRARRAPGTTEELRGSSSPDRPEILPRDARGADWPGDAVVTFTARPETIDIHIAASAPGQLDGLKGAIERHLDRFAFREAPLAYDWR